MRKGNVLADESGVVAVEFALWSTLLFLVISIGLDFALYYIQRSKVDEALSATAISAFNARLSVPYSDLPAYMRTLSENGSLETALSCNGQLNACTNTSRECACLQADGTYHAQACASACTGMTTTAGYYLTIRSRSGFAPFMVPRSLTSDIVRQTTVRLQ
ncbi:TadE family protein [Novosphingobium sp. BL-8A]|uniref:TadE/TadG family type IV pilus assembly protein n=1 Tax=Novosphingobium sp. BL-8A TaxID=3127639 RepID=UPI003757823C